MQFQKEIYEEKFKKLLKENLIVKSNAKFNIKLIYLKLIS